MTQSEFGQLTKGVKIARRKTDDEFHDQTGVVINTTNNGVNIRWQNGEERSYPLTESKFFERPETGSTV